MIAAILIGRKNSKGLPKKNLYKILGQPLALYPMRAAKECSCVDTVFISTDDEQLIKLASKNDVNIIKRPAKLCSDNALGEDVFIHAYNVVRNRYEDSKIELIVLLMCNAATITSDTISEGIRVLRQHPRYDSAVTVSKYNMWSPVRARKIGDDGLLHPFLPFKSFKNLKINCNRDTQGDVWFADMGVSIVRPRCLKNAKNGLLPQKWMGRKIYPLKQWGGLDIDYEWQMPMLEYWLKNHGLGKGKVKS